LFIVELPKNKKEYIMRAVFLAGGMYKRRKQLIRVVEYIALTDCFKRVLIKYS